MVRSRPLPAARDSSDRRAAPATGRASDQILFGETAPIGNFATSAIAARPVATATFWRNLLCLDRSGRSLRTTQPSTECARPPRLFATAISAHHPYVVDGLRSPLTPARPDEITNRRPAAAPRPSSPGEHSVARIAAGLPIYYTEYQISDEPRPTAKLGVRLTKQPEYLNSPTR